jgi:hypothetical protein
MTLRLTLGIDPGKNGAVVALADGVPAGVIDMPLDAEGDIDGARLAASLRGLLQQHPGAAVLVVQEHVNGFGRDAAAFAFRFGQADGIARGVVAALGLRAIKVRPQTWKRHFGLVKARGGPPVGKDASRALVVSLFPNAALPYLRAKDDGRAEALLIALWAEATEAAA